MNQPAQHLRRRVEAAPAPPSQHLRVVGDPGPRLRIRRTRLAVLLGGAALAAVMFGLVVLHVVLAQRQLQLDRLDAAATREQASYQALRLRVAQLESPQRVISTAEGRLAMVQPSAVAYVTPPAGAAVQRPARAVSAPGGAPAGDADWPQIKAAMAGRP